MFQNLRNLRGLAAAAVAVAMLCTAPYAARAAASEDLAKEANGHIERAIAAVKASDYATALSAIAAYRTMGITPAPRILLLQARAAGEVGDYVLAHNLTKVFLASEGLTEEDKKLGGDFLTVISPAAETLIHEEFDNAFLRPHGDTVVNPTRDPAYAILIPPYPLASIKAKEEGRVVLDLFVARDGNTYDAKVQTSSGFPKLDQAAVDTAMTAWRFKPGTVDGEPTAMWFPFAFRFKLPDDVEAEKK